MANPRRTKREPKHCKNCIHSILDETYGEYKCKELKRRVYTPMYEAANCKLFEKKKETKDAAN